LKVIVKEKKGLLLLCFEKEDQINAILKVKKNIKNE
jgi:hypothetical protein